MYAIVPTIEWCEDGTAKVDFMLVIGAFTSDGEYWILSDSLVAEASEKGLSVRVWVQDGNAYFVACNGDELIPRGEGEEIGVAKVFNAPHFKGVL